MVAVLTMAVLATGCGGSNHTSSERSAPPTATVDSTVRLSPGCHRPSGTTTLESGPHTIVVGTSTRSYLLALPAGGVTSNVPRPLIFEFHGAGDGAPDFAAKTELDRKGSGAGFIVVTPAGTADTWQTDAHGTDADFIDALVAEITNSTCVDLDRIFATGFSAGAAFTILYSCARQGLIAAIATVAVDFQLGCTKPMPILAFHGTKDPAVPFDNGAEGISLPGTKVRGTELNMGDWARLDHCQATSVDRTIGSEVTRQTWPSCADGTQVVLYRIEGGGHTWPGADPAKGVGLTTQQVDATDQIVAFFGHHHLG